MKIAVRACAVLAALPFVPLPAGAEPIIKHVIVIAMENTDADQIYNEHTKAEYIKKDLMKHYAYATNYNDPLHLNAPSEPHYIWMEAGTNALGDGNVFLSNDDPSIQNSTSSKLHLVRRMEDAKPPVTWMTYQQGMKPDTCPIKAVEENFYFPKHNPFIFFHDVSGNPPSETHKYCKDHHKPYDGFFKQDLADDKLAQYVFITPNLCNDMHGHQDAQHHNDCPHKENDRITNGDKWLAAELPRMIDWAKQNSGVIFIVWDEGKDLEGDDKEKKPIPFLAIGPGVKAGASDTEFSHGSLAQTSGEIFKLPTLDTVADSNIKSFKELFEDGQYP